MKLLILPHITIILIKELKYETMYEINILILQSSMIIYFILTREI